MLQGRPDLLMKGNKRPVHALCSEGARMEGVPGMWRGIKECVCIRAHTRRVRLHPAYTPVLHGLHV